MVYGDYVTNQKKYISTTTIHMTTKLGNGVTYHEEDPWGSQAGPWIRWSFEITWKTKTTISPLLQSLWPQNLARWWLNLAAFTCKVAWPCIHVFFRDHVTNQNRYISTITMPAATKLRRVGICDEYLISETDTALWSGSLLRSCEMLQVLYLYYNKAYDHQN